MDSDGNYGYKKVGADTVIPFKSEASINVIDYKINITTNIAVEIGKRYILICALTYTNGNGGTGNIKFNSGATVEYEGPLYNSSTYGRYDQLVYRSYIITAIADTISLGPSPSNRFLFQLFKIE